MKIAFIVPALSKLGPIRVVYELVLEYMKTNHEVCVFYFDEKKGFDFPCQVQKINFLYKINFQDYDIIHSHGIRPDAYIFLHKNKNMKTKFITTLHNYVKRDLSYQYNFLISLIFSNVWNFITLRHDAVVVLSSDAKKYYSTFWLNKKLYVIYNGITEEGARISEKILDTSKESKISIGAIGLLTKRKGFDQLLYALQNNHELYLYIVGDGKEMSRLKDTAEKLNVVNQVEFLGYRENASIYLNAFDLFMMPSRSEGFPIALLEAARAKKATVCSDIAIHKEVFNDDEVSYFRLENIESLNLAINNANIYRKKFEDNIHKKFINNYTSSKMAIKYINLYKELKNG